ncbi:MAG: hypothetical protein ABJO97_18060 [Roseibium sp.]|uniref:hypothetical protein n=1 Tax=Roseibium sp. TaxID=1936156 RepID=UPI0032642459
MLFPHERREGHRLAMQVRGVLVWCLAGLRLRLGIIAGTVLGLHGAGANLLHEVGHDERKEIRIVPTDVLVLSENALIVLFYEFHDSPEIHSLCFLRFLNRRCPGVLKRSLFGAFPC